MEILQGFRERQAYETVKSWQGPLWDAINAYMMACGGSSTKGGGPRMDAVAAFNRTLEGLLVELREPRDLDAEVDAAWNRVQPEAARIKIEEAQSYFFEAKRHGRVVKVTDQLKVWDCLVMAKSFLGERAPARDGGAA